MTKSKKAKVFLTAALLTLLAAGKILSEFRWARINTPTGKFANVREYLELGRLPSRVTKAHRDEKTYFIACSPLDPWFALPSGPAAYVFDESGQLVEWSLDPGDDTQFQLNWPCPHVESSLEELKSLGAQ